MHDVLTRFVLDSASSILMLALALGRLVFLVNVIRCVFYLPPDLLVATQIIDELWLIWRPWREMYFADCVSCGLTKGLSIGPGGDALEGQ